MNAHLTTPSAPIMSVHNISKQFGGIRAVNKVSFDVQKGEILGLIGPNRSGKSTVFKAVFGLLNIHSGQILLDGEDVT